MARMRAGRGVMYLFMAVAYVLGGALLGAGLYLVRRDDFPSWWQDWMLWPLVRVTPRVTHLQGWAAGALGTSILALGSLPSCPGGFAGVSVFLGRLPTPPAGAPFA